MAHKDAQEYVLFDYEDNELPLMIGTMKEIQEYTGIPLQTLYKGEMYQNKIRNKYGVRRIEEDDKYSKEELQRRIMVAQANIKSLKDSLAIWEDDLAELQAMLEELAKED